MQDVSFLIYHTNRTGTEYPRLLYQSTGHNTVGHEQVVHRVRVQFIQPFIDFVGVFDFRNIFGRRQNTLAI